MDDSSKSTNDNSDYIGMHITAEQPSVPDKDDMSIITGEGSSPGRNKGRIPDPAEDAFVATKKLIKIATTLGITPEELIGKMEAGEDIEKLLLSKLK